MIKDREITAAIAAHGLWKSRLRQAIDTGSIDGSIRSIETDDECQFGQWLAGVADEAKAAKYSRQWSLVKKRHAEFHKVAARVAQCVVDGKKSEAEEMMSARGEYSLASAMLTEAMIEWKGVLTDALMRQPAAK